MESFLRVVKIRHFYGQPSASDKKENERLIYYCEIT